ncbi:AAA ATPase [Puccinia graminis f. sp. tritici]|uniref:AAA ATPase n=1 Tax=Puccinia graminis f. sp. tritici TaxID=56615 RepID=A0A5B0MCG9_PUCGR|nr:AAA ATPase [Puccinia graminis f. sp. tritici]
MVSTRRTPSRLDSIPQGFTLVSKAPLKSAQSKRVGLRPRSLHCDVSEPEASSDICTSDTIAWSSSPPPSPKKRTLRSSKPCKNNGSVGFPEATPLPKSHSMASCAQEAGSPVRKRLRAIENIQTRSGISKSRSQPQSLSKNLTSLCDKLVVETPKNNPIPFKTFAGFSNVFAHARHLLKLSSTDIISCDDFLGRSKELHKLKKFLSERYPSLTNLGQAPVDSSSTHANSSSGSLYISGPPGTGKTHMIKSVLLNQDHVVGRALNMAGVQVHFINCVALNTSTGTTGLSSGTGSNALDEQLWNHVAACLGIARSASTNGKHLTSRALVETHVMENKVLPSLIILDEIDYLAASKLPLITPLLSLSQRSPNANFTIVGIANTLDLTTRLVKSSASLASNTNLEPQLIHFTSFESTDLVDIAKQRLRHLYTSYAQSAGPGWPVSTPQKLFACSTPDVSSNQDATSIPLFHPAALQLCAKKVAAVTGDLRTFLSILRKLVDSLEQNAIRNSQFLEQSLGSQKSVLDTPTKMRKFTRIISTSQLAPDLGGRSSENEWSKAKTKDPCNHFTPNTAPKISPSDVVKYLKTSGILESPTFNTSQAECLKKLQDLNLHQSLVLVCLCVAWSREQDETNNVGCGVTRSQAYEIYRDCLKPGDGYGSRNSFNVGINPVSESEWADLLESGLQTRGLVSCLNERPGLSRPSTPSTSHNNPGPSPFKSPSKRKQGAFQRSALCTPTKLKPIGFNSPHSSHRLSTPAKSVANDRGAGQALLTPVHSISVLIQAVQSLANQSTQTLCDDAPRFSPEIISILNQLLLSEEKRARVLKKRKAAHLDQAETLGRKAAFSRLDDDDLDQENLVNHRLVTVEDEGSCRD